MALSSPSRITHRAAAAFGAFLLSGCGGGGLDLDPDDDFLGGTGGTARFTMQGASVPTLPVQACLGLGQVFVLSAVQGKTVVDITMIENPTLREGQSLEESTAVGYRTAPSGSSIDFTELWVSSRVTAASRNGSQVTVSGFMTGTSWQETSPGVGGNAQSIDDGAERSFSITATCGR